MAGTEHGEVFRVEVEEVGGGRGVVWVTVSVEESLTWRLIERDLETCLELSPAMALLGGRTQAEWNNPGPGFILRILLLLTPALL